MSVLFSTHLEISANPPRLQIWIEVQCYTIDYYLIYYENP